MKGSRPHRSILLAAAAVAVFVAILMVPSLSLGFVADDAPNSALAQTALASRGISLGQFIASDFENWMRAGRFFPLSHYVRVLFWAINGSVILYRSFVMLLIAVNIGLFAFFIRRLTGSVGLSLLGAILVPALFQIRYYHDPIVSFAGLLQVTTGLTLLSLIMLLIWLDAKRPYQLAMSLVFYAMSLLTYEIGLPFFLLHAFLIWWYPSRRAPKDVLRMAWPFAATAIAVAAVPIVFRVTLGVAMTGDASAGIWTPHLAPIPILVALAKQTLGALPLSYYAARAAGTQLGLTSGFFFGTPVQYLMWFPVASVSLLTLATLATATAARTASSELQAQPSRDRRTVLLAGLGLGLWLLPGALISLSPVRQAELYWGASYLPVYLSYFGVALLTLVALRWALARWPRQAAVIGASFGIVVGLLGMIWYGNSVTSAELLNREWLYPRTVAENAVSEGLLEGVGRDATIITSDAHFWDNPDFFVNLGVPRPAAVISLADRSSVAETFSAEVTRSSRGAAPTYYLDYAARSDGSGYALLARVSTLTAGPDGAFEVEGAPLAYYVQTPSGQTARARKVSALLPTESPLPSPSALGLPPTDAATAGAKGSLARYPGGTTFLGSWAPTPHWR